MKSQAGGPGQIHSTAFPIRPSFSSILFLTQQADIILLKTI